MSGSIGKIGTDGDIMYVEVERAMGGQPYRIDLPQGLGEQIIKVLNEGVDKIKEEITKRQYKSTLDDVVKGTKYEKV